MLKLKVVPVLALILTSGASKGLSMSFAATAGGRRKFGSILPVPVKFFTGRAIEILRRPLLEVVPEASTSCLTLTAGSRANEYSLISSSTVSSDLPSVRSW